MVIGSVSSATALGGRSTQEDRVVERWIDGVGLLLAVLDGYNGEDVAAAGADLLMHCQVEASSSIESLVAEVASLGRDFSDAGATLSAALIRFDGASVEVAVVGDSPVLVAGANGDTFHSSRHVGWESEIERAAAVGRGGFFYNGYMYNQTDTGERDAGGGAVLLTRAIGSTRFGFLSETPDVERLRLDGESFVLIGSDGVLFERSRRDPDTFTQLTRSRVAKGWSAEMFVSEAVEAGARDNVSVVLWRASEE